MAISPFGRPSAPVSSWASPFGRLRVDYGYALSKESYDETQQLRFGAATEF